MRLLLRGIRWWRLIRIRVGIIGGWIKYFEFFV